MIIKFSELDRVYVPIYIKPLNSYTMLQREFKVDTGADSTTISKEVLYNMGYTPQWVNSNIIEKGFITLANNTEVEAGVIQLSVINILGYECKQWPFIIIIEDGVDFRNLLGRDLLAGFNYMFNNDKKEFNIENSKSFSYIGKRYKGQDIHNLEQLKPSSIFSRV